MTKFTKGLGTFFWASNTAIFHEDNAATNIAGELKSYVSSFADATASDRCNLCAISEKNAAPQRHVKQHTLMNTSLQLHMTQANFEMTNPVWNPLQPSPQPMYPHPMVSIPTTQDIPPAPVLNLPLPNHVQFNPMPPQLYLCSYLLSLQYADVMLERTIRTFNNHFITGVASRDPSFPLALWDLLIPQGESTLYL